MKYAATVLLALLVAGCGTTNATDQYAAQQWAATVQPADPVPEECVTRPRGEPKYKDGAKDNTESAKIARSYLTWGRAVSKDYERCQTWAKGQRK